MGRGEMGDEGYVFVGRGHWEFSVHQTCLTV